MNCSKIIFFSIFLVIFATEMNGQQSPVFSQYVMNGFLVNPSMAGRDGFTTVNLTVREQWIGMKGGPSTYAASFQTNPGRNNYSSRLLRGGKKVSRPTKPSRVGIGGSIFNDNNGIISRTGVKVDYAYHIPLGNNRDGQDDFSMGLGMVTYLYSLKTDKLQYSYADDPFLTTYDRNVFVTDFSFGTSYTTEKFYLGFSMTNILRGALVYGNSSDNKGGEKGHYYLTGGVNIPLNRDWAIKPSAFIKASDLLLKSVQADITTRVFYKENYWAGVSYRTSDAIVLMMGLRYDKYYIANAFDFTLTDIRGSSFGSYEITLAIKFGDSPRKYRWLNSF
jgi:type IX secretion system PorP/SprF family membrane protein